MKFKSFLKENTEEQNKERFEKWFRDTFNSLLFEKGRSYNSNEGVSYAHTLNHEADISDVLKAIDLSDLSVRPAYHTCVIEMRPGASFDWILKVDDRLENVQFEGKSIWTLPNFTNVPNTRRFNMFRGNISSFKDIEKREIEELVLHDSVNVDCGILRLLKPKLLVEVKYYNDDEDSPTSRAFSILNKLRNDGESTVADLQQELIEEGLQEFAKL